MEKDGNSHQERLQAGRFVSSAPVPLINPTVSYAESVKKVHSLRSPNAVQNSLGDFPAISGASGISSSPSPPLNATSHLSSVKAISGSQNAVKDHNGPMNHVHSNANNVPKAAPAVNVWTERLKEQMALAPTCTHQPQRQPRTIVINDCLPTPFPLIVYKPVTLRQQWDVLPQCKAHIQEFVWSLTVSTGVKVFSIKFMQRIIIVQTRGISGPTLQNKKNPNISNVPADHPFLPGPDHNVVYQPQRPALVQLVVSSLSSWTPGALSGLPASSVEGVGKAVRILLIEFQGVLKSNIEDPMVLPLELSSTRRSLYDLHA
ncbi:hypothetical protein EDD22DRAFT_1050139 [Suillus occidentalis]|nr:hypothetical protein EDD22DRAFT_1050139 [Suillus occidentalis]